MNEAKQKTKYEILLPRVGEAGRGLKKGNRPSSNIDPNGMWSDAAYRSDVTGYNAYRLSRYRTFHNYNASTDILGKSMNQLHMEELCGRVNEEMQLIDAIIGATTIFRNGRNTALDAYFEIQRETFMDIIAKNFKDDGGWLKISSMDEAIHFLRDAQDYIVNDDGTAVELLMYAVERNGFVSYWLTPFGPNMNKKDAQCETYSDWAGELHNQFGYDILIQMHSHPENAYFSKDDMDNLRTLNSDYGLSVDMMVVAPKKYSTTTRMQEVGDENPHPDLNYYRYNHSKVQGGYFSENNNEPGYLSNTSWNRKAKAYYGNLIFF